MRHWRLGLAAALLWAVGLAQAQGLLPVPPLSGRVIDQTATLSAAQVQALGDKLAAEENQVVHVHEALARLEQVDRRLAQVVEMRYFVGMSEAEIGEVLGVTERTVRRDWQRARLLLAAALS